MHSDVSVHDHLLPSLWLWGKAEHDGGEHTSERCTSHGCWKAKRELALTSQSLPLMPIKLQFSQMDSFIPEVRTFTIQSPPTPPQTPGLWTMMCWEPRPWHTSLKEPSIVGNDPLLVKFCTHLRYESKNPGILASSLSSSTCPPLTFLFPLLCLSSSFLPFLLFLQKQCMLFKYQLL